MSFAALRRANLEDVAGITACVCEAYVHYIERIGKRPGPMIEDFEHTVRTAQVHVAESKGGRIVGSPSSRSLRKASICITSQFARRLKAVELGGYS